MISSRFSEYKNIEALDITGLEVFQDGLWKNSHPGVWDLEVFTDKL
jgi:hypothetical protein